MGKLYFRISSDWEEVVKLRNEIEKLKQTLLSMNKNQTPDAVTALEVQLGAARQRMDELVTTAAKAGVEMEMGFKNKIFDASQTVNGFTEKIIAQKAVVKDVEADVKRLGESYRSALKNNPLSANSKLSEYSSAKKALDEEKAALFGLTQEQANARLSVKKLRDEYALYQNDGNQAVSVNDNISASLKKAFAVIGGAAAIKKLGSEIIRVRGEFQSMQTSIETLVGKDMAGNLIPQIKELAKISPLTLSDMVGAEKMMLGFNIKAEDTIKYLQALGDISMGDSQKFSSLTLAFSQMSAAGKLMGQDLNQMINAGFNPLQIISEKTGKSIAQLKDEMSKGAISTEMVQQAFVDATSAGGRFFGMSENASKTINGQISMMQDAMDAAFNEMGKKSEGFIMSGIQMTTSLIENYETIGKVITGLIITYGVYKTALIANIALTRDWAVAARADAVAKGIQTIATKAQTVAQLALNSAMKANPYVLAATLIVGVASAMWILADNTTEAEKAQQRFNKKQEEAAKQEQEHKQKIDSLVESSRDIALANLQRGQSLAELRKEYPKIFEKYDIETIKLADILKLKQQIAEEDVKRAEEKKAKEFSDIEEEIKYYENLLKALSGQQGVDGYVKKLKELRATRDVMLQDKGKGISEQFISSLKDIDISEFGRYISELEKRIKGQGENGKIKLRLPIDAKGSLSDEAIYEVKNIKTLIDTAKSTKQTRIDAEKNKTTYQEDLATAKADWEKAKKGYEILLKDQKATSEQVKKARDDMQAKEKAYKDLGGVTNFTSQESSSDKLRAQQEKLTLLMDKQALDQSRSAEDLQTQVDQARINAMGEGSIKTLEQMKLDHSKEMQQLERQQEDLLRKKIEDARAIFDAQEDEKAANKPGYVKQTFDGSKVTLSQSEKDAFANQKMYLDLKQVGETQALLDKERQSWNEYLAEYGTFQEKKEAITAEYNEKISSASTKGEKESLKKELENRIKEINLDELKASINFADIFGDLDAQSTESLTRMRDKLKEIIEKSAKDLKPTDLKSLQDAFKEIDIKVSERNPFGELKQGIEDYRNATQAAIKAQEDLNTVQQGGEMF